MTKKHIFHGDSIDDIIIGRKLDQHPEHLKSLLKEHRVEGMIDELMEHDVFPLMPLMRSRVLNFIEAGVRGDLSVNERRVGLAVAIIISSADISDQKVSDLSMSISTVLPVHLAMRKNYMNFIQKTVFTEAERELIRQGVTAFRAYMPSANTFKSSRVLMFLRDACMAWIGTGDKEVQDFILMRGENPRSKHIGPRQNEYHAQRLLNLLVEDEKIHRNMFHPYAISSMTQWGTARTFEHNYAAKVKALVPALESTY